MKYTYYGSGEEIKIGDYVRIKRFLRSPIYGIITFVYNPQKPSPIKGDNPKGFTIKVSEYKLLFFTQARRSIELISRD